MSNRLADLAVGATLGALSASQGIAMPGAVLVGLGYDATIAGVHAINEKWFPMSEPLTLTDVLVTSVGTAIGWWITQAIFPIRENPQVISGSAHPLSYVPVAAAGLAVMALPGRLPGRLRQAAYRTASSTHATYSHAARGIQR